MPDVTVPLGFRCRCGLAHRFTLYVFAHAHLALHFRCPGCRLGVTVRHGRAVPDVPPRWPLPALYAGELATPPPPAG